MMPDWAVSRVAENVEEQIVWQMNSFVQIAKVTVLGAIVTKRDPPVRGIRL